MSVYNNPIVNAFVCQTGDQGRGLRRRAMHGRTAGKRVT